MSLSITPAGWTRNLCLKVLSNRFCPPLPFSHKHTHTHTHRNTNTEKQYTFKSMNPWPLIGNNPGLLLAFILDIIPWEDIFTKWGLPIVPYVRGVEQRMKPQPTLCVWSFHFTQTCIIGTSFLDPEDIKSLSLGAIWKFSKGTGLPWIGIRLWGT